MFFRAWVMLSMAIFRLWPLLATGVYARRHPVSQGTWGVALAATCVLLVIAQVSAMRCSSEHLSHTRGLFAIGAAMSTGWLYVDALLVPRGGHRGAAAVGGDGAAAAGAGALPVAGAAHAASSDAAVRPRHVRR